MSLKDLIARAAAALKLKLAETVKTPATENESKAAGNEAPAKSKIS